MFQCVTRQVMMMKLHSRISHGQVSTLPAVTDHDVSSDSAPDVNSIIHWRLLYKFWSINSILWIQWNALIQVWKNKLSPQPVLFKLFHGSVTFIWYLLSSIWDSSKLLVARKQRSSPLWWVSTIAVQFLTTLVPEVFNQDFTILDEFYLEKF